MFHPDERQFAMAIRGLASANPFRRREVAGHEEAAMAFRLPTAEGPPLQISERPRIGRLVSQAERLLGDWNQRGAIPERLEDVQLHAAVVRFVLYFQFRAELQASVADGFREATTPTANWSGEFEARFHALSRTPPAIVDAGTHRPLADPEHVLASFFQIRRAYHLIQSQLIGQSAPIQQLRAAAWESVFTLDMEQYGQWMFDRMHDLSTLIVGPSGTGKELVARTVGLSRFIPFSSRTRQFSEPFLGAFRAVNLAALSPALIESELFGHAAGAFTGAHSAREGWFESCGSRHSVFLDEIGELAPSIQVKLLRVLQERSFQRIGELKPRSFAGKVIAATHRDLAKEMQLGRFRHDLFYRLCSDVIETPSLRAQLNDSPDDVQLLIASFVRRHFGRELPALEERAGAYIQSQLPGYSWPGNVRELEQCVRSVLLRGRYVPLADPTRPSASSEPAGSSSAHEASFTGLVAPTAKPAHSMREQLAERLRRKTPTGDELLNEYCRVLYAEHGSYTEVSRLIGLDRRTVQRRVNA